MVDQRDSLAGSCGQLKASITAARARRLHRDAGIEALPRLQGRA